MVMKRKKGRRISKPSNPIGILKDGKVYRFAFGTKSNPRKGRKVFFKKKTIMAEARKKGFVR